MNPYQGLNNVSAYLNRSLASSFAGLGQSTLWVNHSEGQPISDMMNDETKTEMVMPIQICKTNFVVLDGRNPA